MRGAVAPKAIHARLRVPDDILALVDEPATPMQRPRSFAITEALPDFITAELEDARVVAQEVAASAADPDSGGHHDDALAWLSAHGWPAGED